MENNPLGQEIAKMRPAFFKEGMMDKFFAHLQKIGINGNQEFGGRNTVFFRDSAEGLVNIEEDFRKVDEMLLQLKYSNASIGAVRINAIVDERRKFWKEKNLDSGKATFQELKTEHNTLKQKLELYFQMLRQVGQAETEVRAI